MVGARPLRAPTLWMACKLVSAFVYSLSVFGIYLLGMRLAIGITGDLDLRWYVLRHFPYVMALAFGAFILGFVFPLKRRA